MLHDFVQLSSSSSSGTSVTVKLLMLAATLFSVFASRSI